MTASTEFTEARLRALELFPTPPWATRALFEFVLPKIFGGFRTRLGSCLEPAAGLGHMAETLKEYCESVVACDVADYPLDDGSLMSERGLEIVDFLDPETRIVADWVCTNPPFKQTESFLHRALMCASKGVALLQKQTWLTGGERFHEVYAQNPPDLVAQFAERVPMFLGGYDPHGSSDMDYAWFIWLTPEGLEEAGPEWRQRRENAPVGWLQLLLIPPGRRDAYFRASDEELAETRRLPGWVPDQKIRKLRRIIHAERDARMRGEIA